MLEVVVGALVEVTKAEVKFVEVVVPEATKANWKNWLVRP
jgi:hypothetical protein